MVGRPKTDRIWVPAKGALALLRPFYKTEREVKNAIINRCAAGVINSKCERQTAVSGGKHHDPTDKHVIGNHFWSQFQDEHLRIHEDWLAGDFTLFQVDPRGRRDAPTYHIKVIGAEFDEGEIRAVAGLPSAEEAAALSEVDDETRKAFESLPTNIQLRTRLYMARSRVAQARRDGNKGVQGIGAMSNALASANIPGNKSTADLIRSFANAMGLPDPNVDAASTEIASESPAPKAPSKPRPDKLKGWYNQFSIKNPDAPMHVVKAAIEGKFGDGSISRRQTYALIKTRRKLKAGNPRINRNSSEN